MSQDLISRYNNTVRIQFHNSEMEKGYRQQQQSRARRSGVLGFTILLLLNLAFAYLEYRAFGHDVALPMYGYLAAAGLALGNLMISQFLSNPYQLNLRLIVNGVASMCCVIWAVYLQKYSAYHLLEMSLLIIWLGSLNVTGFLTTALISLVMVGGFLAILQLTNISSFWINLVAILLLITAVVSCYLAYVLERQRRSLFLQTALNHDMSKRQETWAYTLIDLDMALSGIIEFGEMIGMLKKHLETVIDFDSYILTSLEGQGPKPVADKIEGTLFETEDKTLWSEEVLSKLTQTRQATVSAEHEIVKGKLGGKRKKFLSYRMDIPVFSDLNLKGVIALRRVAEPFNDLDMIASVSIASQAMLIFQRTAKNSAVIAPSSAPVPATRQSAAAATSKIATSQSTDMEVTDLSYTDPNGLVATSELMKKARKVQEKAKKTITLLSRENADKIAIDKYRTAVVEGDPLSVVIIEIDGLSKLREQDGDHVAYKVFASIVKYIFSTVDKQKDTLGRYGQNGLSVLLPEIDMNAAERFAEKIRLSVSETRYKTTYGDRTATLSIGVAAMTDETSDYASMVKRADMALFVAKKSGRNCVKVRL
ncbi:MAG: diguanylate cyclase [Gammaproteobacteria bacterium]|nr:diguanylate cyclase [Gammaproteobacteria bacterium]